jgi:two-component system, OmpR family, sensor histidine kinase BaeS
MFHSIRWRLIGSYILLAIVTVSVVGILAVEIVRQYARQRERADMQANAQVIASQAAPYFWSGIDERSLNQLAQSASFLGNLRVRFLDPNGVVLVDSGTPDSNSEMVLVDPPEGQDLLPGSQSDWLNMMMLPQQNRDEQYGQALLESLPPGSSLTIVRRYYTPWGMRFSFQKMQSLSETSQNALLNPQNESPSRSDVSITQPVGDPERPMGWVELSSAPNLAADALSATRRALFLAGLGAAFLAFILGSGISQRLSSPLKNLNETARQMGAGDLAIRAEIRSKDEIGDLARQFNQMAGQLQANFQQLESERDALRRFIADASHELRTPITALKNFITLLQGPAASDPNAQAEFLQESQAQVNRLEWITQNLLDLSRSDAGLVDLEMVEQDLQELLVAAAAPFKLSAAKKNIDLEFDLPEEPVRLTCDRARVELALGNLLDNAIRYCPPGSRVQLGARQAGATIRIWVEDNGPGIDLEDLPHIFARFYRGRNASESGSGLGLSIAASTVHAQGGAVRAENLPTGGVRFILEWPSAGNLM